MTGPLIMFKRMVPTSVRLRTVLEPTIRMVKLNLLTPWVTIGNVPGSNTVVAARENEIVNGL